MAGKLQRARPRLAERPLGPGTGSDVQLGRGPPAAPKRHHRDVQDRQALRRQDRRIVYLFAARVHGPRPQARLGCRVLHAKRRRRLLAEQLLGRRLHEKHNRELGEPENRRRRRAVGKRGFRDLVRRPVVPPVSGKPHRRKGGGFRHRQSAEGQPGCRRLHRHPLRQQGAQLRRSGAQRLFEHQRCAFLDRRTAERGFGADVCRHRKRARQPRP